MRTHFLAELRIDGQGATLAKIPEFDFYRLGRVTRLRLQDTASDSGSELTIEALYDVSHEGRNAGITLSFLDVRYARLPTFSPAYFLNELEIEDVRDRQLEGIGFQAKCHGGSDFEVHSRMISIVSSV